MTPYNHAWRTRTRPFILYRAGGRFPDAKYAGAAKCERCGWIDCLHDGCSELDVAHLVIPPGEPGHDEPENLAALCRRCHRAHDYAEWARKCYETRSRRKDAARPLLQHSENPPSCR